MWIPVSGTVELYAAICLNAQRCQRHSRSRRIRTPTPELCVYEIQKKERDLDRERDWAAIDRKINVQAFDHGTVDKGLNNEVVKYNILNALHITKLLDSSKGLYKG